jgi:predicted nuclease of restriction endonuclease-like RecB superfamily
MSIPITSLPAKYQMQASSQIHAQPLAKVRLRQQTGDGLNKTERAFLEHLKRIYDRSPIYSQDVTLRIGNGTRYTPDFMVDLPGGAVFFETKGFMRDDAAVKIKVAARMYPLFRFHLVTKGKKGTWDIQHILP